MPEHWISMDVSTYWIFFITWSIATTKASKTKINVKVNDEAFQLHDKIVFLEQKGNWPKMWVQQLIFLTTMISFHIDVVASSTSEYLVFQGKFHKTLKCYLKDTVSGHCTWLDIILYILKQVPANRTERLSNCNVLITFSVSQFVRRILK